MTMQFRGSALAQDRSRRGLCSVLFALAAVLQVGCEGRVDSTPTGDDDEGDDGSDPGLPPSPGGGDPSTPPAAGPSFRCDTKEIPTTSPAQRLTRMQHANSLRDLLRFALGSKDDAVAVLASSAADLSKIPEDTATYIGAKSEGFAFGRMDQVLSDAHVSASYHAAIAIGAAVSRSIYREKLLGPCGTDPDSGNDAKCLSDFIARFGARAFRSPLRADDVAFYTKLGRDGGGPVGSSNIANVVAGILSAPRFFYRIESGDKFVPDSGDRQVQLTAYELAARLSFQFWDTIPDEDLWQAAANGSLLAPETFREQLKRLVADPRAQSSMAQFYRQWLQLDQVPALDEFKDSARFKAFAKGQTPSATLKDAMAQELVDMADHFTWKVHGGISDLLLTNASFARSPELAALYNVQTWDGRSEPPSFPDGQRPGLLTRGAVLASASGLNRPIMRGVFVRGRILCDELPDPPAGALDNLPPVPAGLSTRDEVEQISERTQPCAGCHKTLINPIGFMFEGYDALGRKRTEDISYDANGKMLAAHGIDDTAVPRVNFEDETQAQGAAELAKLIVASGKVSACMARQYFRFSMGRKEDVERDGCALERLRRAFGGDKGLSEGFSAIALDPSFWQRSF